MNKIILFFKDVKMEMGRVNWPTRQQTVKFTLVVVVMSAVLAAFLGALDFIFVYILNFII